MAYNPYAGNPYGMPPNYNPYPAGNPVPGMGHPGLGPPPGMSSAPGMAPASGVQQLPSATQANRLSGLPPSFQPPPNLPNINFNAPVIRLGGASSLPARPTGPAAMGGGTGRRDSEAPLSGGGLNSGGHLHGDFRHDGRGGGISMSMDPGRAALRGDTLAAVQAPPTSDEKLRTLFVHKVPAGVGGEAAVEALLGLVGKLRRWDASASHLPDHEGELFGFAQYEDPDSLASALALLKDVEVPLKKQEPRDAPFASSDDEEAAYQAIEKEPLKIAVDPVSLQYIQAHQDTQSDEAAAEVKARREAGRVALQAAVRQLFFPPPSQRRDGHGHGGDVSMTGGEGTAGDGVEVVNIPLAQDDELSDIPAEFREMVASEIASFREQSTRRDMERLRKEQEMEEAERRRSGEDGSGSPNNPTTNNSTNNIPLGPRGGGANGTTTGARGSSRTIHFVSGGEQQHYHPVDDPDTDASDEELYRRERRKQAAEEDKLYQEAERKWVNRERQRAAALERETERDRAEAENATRHREEQLERERTWDDEREASRKSTLYYRDHAAWLRKRAHDRADEEARDAADRRAEKNEQRKHAAEMETAQSLADSFLEQHADELERADARRQRAQDEAAATATASTEAAAAPQRVTISFGAAAQRAQAQRQGPTRRTVAEVEGLLDDEEQEGTTKRQLVPIKFEPMAASASMSDEEINRAVRSLAAEIPTEKAGLWAWAVQWEGLDEGIIRDKLRPFVEKKVVEYLGVQEQFLVEVVEEHLRKHGKPEELVDELQEALDEAAEDLVKKLWRMVIFFTECEKRGLPA